MTFNNQLKYYVLDTFCKRPFLQMCMVKYQRVKYFLDYDTKGVQCGVKDNLLPAFQKCSGELPNTEVALVEL